MRKVATWIAAVATAALLAGSLSGAPAYAEDVPPEPVATTINLRYAAVDSTVTVTGASTVDDAITEFVTQRNAGGAELVENCLVVRELRIRSWFDNNADRNAGLIPANNRIREAG